MSTRLDVSSPALGEVLDAHGELVAFFARPCELADQAPALPEYVFAWTEHFVRHGHLETEEREIAVYAIDLAAALAALGYPARGSALGPCGHVFPLIEEWIEAHGRSNLTVFRRGGRDRVVLEEIHPPALHGLSEPAFN